MTCFWENRLNCEYVTLRRQTSSTRIAKHRSFIKLKFLQNFCSSCKTLPDQVVRIQGSTVLRLVSALTVFAFRQASSLRTCLQSLQRFGWCSRMDFMPLRSQLPREAKQSDLWFVPPQPVHMTATTGSALAPFNLI
jgi:hypothetical protein